MSLDYDIDSEEGQSFHQLHHCQMMCLSPGAKCTDLMWQMTKWLWVCEEGLDEAEINWWSLVSPLTDGSNVATKELAK